MAKYLVKTDVLFLTDTVSVKKGTFDSKDVPVDEGIIMDKCKFHPKDIEQVSSDSSVNSKAEKDGKEVKTEKKDEGEASDVTDKGPEAGGDAGQGEPQPNAGDTHPKAEEDISVNEIKAFLKEKKVDFDNKANKDSLYQEYLKACNA